VLIIDVLYTRDVVHPAPQEATGVNPWRNGDDFPKGNNVDATAVKPWCGVHFLFEFGSPYAPLVKHVYVFRQKAFTYYSN
jgi:hypothetical protein